MLVHYWLVQTYPWTPSAEERGYHIRVQVCLQPRYLTGLVATRRCGPDGEQAFEKAFTGMLAGVYPGPGAIWASLGRRGGLRVAVWLFVFTADPHNHRGPHIALHTHLPCHGDITYYPETQPPKR